MDIKTICDEIVNFLGTCEVSYENEQDWLYLLNINIPFSNQSDLVLTTIMISPNNSLTQWQIRRKLSNDIIACLGFQNKLIDNERTFELLLKAIENMSPQFNHYLNNIARLLVNEEYKTHYKALMTIKQLREEIDI